ncbi:hypothetical protein ABPG77_008353 [Micractinium sp. CCAP 211/92]
MEELDWEGSDDEHPAQEAPHEEGGDDEGLEGLEGLHSRQVAEQPQQVQRAGSMTPPGSPERPGGAANGRAATTGTAAASASAAAGAANGEPVPEEWQVMDIPEEWRPRPMVRVWGLPAAAQEEELAQLLEATLAEQRASVRSVVFDPRQTTAAGKVALVRFEPPPPPEEGAAEPDAGKVAEKLIAALRAAAPQLHGTKINVEKTGAEVCLFLSNLPSDADSDEGLRSACAVYGALERCFVMRNPAGASKGYAFAEFTLPGSAAACKEAWNKAGEALRPQLPRESSGEVPKRVKLQRAEAAPVKTVSGLFGRVLYVDGIQTALTDSARLQRIFSEYGEVTSCHLPRSPIDPTRCRGFAFLHFKHSFAADAAYRVLDGTEHPGIGRLVISFSNPVKANDPSYRPASAAGGAQRAQQGQQQPRADSRQGGLTGQHQGQQLRGRAGTGLQGGGTGAIPTPAASLLPSVVGPGGAMAPIILPASALPTAMARPPPPPGAPPPPTVAAAALQQRQQHAQQQQQQQVAALAQQQAMMQQMAIMQQMAMQQAMMQQAAAAELQRKQKEEAEKAEAERKRKEEAEKARREQEYAQRLGYAAFGGLPGAAGSMAGGMPAAMASMAAALPGMAGFMNPAAMAAMMGMPGMAEALGATAAGAGAGSSAAGPAAATTATAGGGSAVAAEPAGAGQSPIAEAYGGGGSRRDAGYGGSQRGGYGDGPGGADPYDAGKGSYRGGGGGGYGRERGYDHDRDAYGDDGYDAYGGDYGGGYGGGARSGYGGGSRRGGGGGGYGGSNRGGGRSKRDNDYQGGYGGSSYGGGGYSTGAYPPKRPRY